MELTSQGALRLVAIIATCRAKRGEGFSAEQKTIIQEAVSGKEFLLNHVGMLFNLEEGTRQSLSDFARSKNLEKIGDETVLNFFGGLPHLEYSLRDIESNGVGNLWPSFLLFHMLLPVEIADSRGFVGIYNNFGKEVAFQQIKSIGLEKESIAVGNWVLIHYGLIVGRVGEELAKKLIAEQCQLEKLGLACSEVFNINCDQLRRFTQAG